MQQDFSDLAKAVGRADYSAKHCDSIYLNKDTWDMLNSAAESIRSELKQATRISPKYLDDGVPTFEQWIARTKNVKLYLNYTSKVEKGEVSPVQANQELREQFYTEYPTARPKQGRPHGGGHVPTNRHIISYLIELVLSEHARERLRPVLGIIEETTVA